MYREKSFILSYIAHPSSHITPPITKTASFCNFSVMPSSCKDIRKLLPRPLKQLDSMLIHGEGAELATCLQYSDCVFVHRNKPGDCLRPPLRDTLPTQCQQLQKSYAACKKGWVDMRKCFRGNRPISVSQELEGDASGQSYQLYAGKPAFSSVTPTDGREHERLAGRDDDDED